MNAIEKNTVSARNQLAEKEYVRFINPENAGKRIMFLGNSITLHGPNQEIGWLGDWGMAASAKEKDYAHILMEKIRQIDSDAAFCICQGSRWESDFKHTSNVTPKYEPARDFCTDIIVMRLAENVDGTDFDGEIFLKNLEEYLGFLTELNPGAKIILTTPFWHHICEGSIREYATRKHYPLVELGDLGELDEMKALGLFAHEGVANHPGDKGMQAIADRIFAELKLML